MISIVIPVYGQVHWTRRCLESLLKHSEIARELVIVDNHSTDETPTVLREMAPLFEKQGWKFTVITNAENRGFGRACNQGILASGGPSASKYVAVINNDTWHMPGWDRALVGAIEKLDAAMIGPSYYEKAFDEKMLLRKSHRFSRRNKGKYREFWVPMFMFFKREALEKVGNFDERYFVSYEEIDMRVQFDRLGMKYYIVGDCLIWHAVKGTRGNPKIIASDHETEGRRIFMDKWKFDPDDLRPGHFTWPERLKRRWQRIKFGLDFF